MVKLLPTLIRFRERREEMYVLFRFPGKEWEQEASDNSEVEATLAPSLSWELVV